jgi:membrane fusion protein (multidrug efflux system)
MLFSLPLLAAVAFSGCSEASGQTRTPVHGPAPIVEATLTSASEIEVPRVLALSGTLIGNEQARVAAGATGKVLVTHVERGQLVKKGAVLADLDRRALRAQANEAAAQLESLKAQRAQAELDCERNQRLFARGAIARAEFDRSRTGCATSAWSVSAAEARKTLTAEALRDAEIRAPFTGMVVERNVTAGEYVRPDSVVATLVDVEALRIELTVPETAVAEVERGMKVLFRTASSGGNREYAGRVRYIGPSVRQQTRDAVVEAVVENQAHELRPGMFVTAKLELGQESLPGVPETAVRSDGGQRRVFVEVGGRLEERVVQVAEPKRGVVPVLDGLRPGERVVAMLTPAIRDGARLK